MSFVISSFVPFPNLSWWISRFAAQEVLWDASEHFQKMTFRNRYYIAGATRKQMLSIPIAEGRNNRRPMRDIAISYHEDWRKQHWRTLFSAYNRSPFFSYYAPTLEVLFRKQHRLLSEFSLESYYWCCQQLRIQPEDRIVEVYRKDYPESAADLRNLRPQDATEVASLRYQQVFQERHGFIPNLSVLDLLCAEGPGAGLLLRQWARST